MLSAAHPLAAWGSVLGGGSAPPGRSWQFPGGGADPPSSWSLLLGGACAHVLNFTPPPASVICPPLHLNRDADAEMRTRCEGVVLI